MHNTRALSIDRADSCNAISVDVDVNKSVESAVITPTSGVKFVIDNIAEKPNNGCTDPESPLCSGVLCRQLFQAF